MNVVRLATPNLKDVPNSLRNLAEVFEEGDEFQAEHAIVVAVDADGELRTYGYGAVGNRAHEIGVLQMAIIQMAAY